MNNCLNCGVETQNPKFCSKSCAAKVNNEMVPKRKPRKDYFCERCGVQVSNRRKLCDACHCPDITLAEATYDNLHRSSAFCLIRTRARKIAKRAGWCKCSKCGYDKHVEIAHKRPISDFPEDTMISVINSLDNLIALCPNCHWEYDHPS